MKIIKVNYKILNLPFHKPIFTDRLHLKYKKVCRLYFFSENGNKIIRDVSPLTSFSKENFEDTVAFLENFFQEYQSLDLTKQLCEEMRAKLLPTSLLVALESIILEESISKEYKHQCREISFLLTQDYEKSVSNTIKRGFRVFKLKAKEDIDETLKILKILSRYDIKIRLDVNHLWEKKYSHAEKMAVIKSLEKYQSLIEYVEDISLDKDEIANIQSSTLLSLAIDEIMTLDPDLPYFLNSGIKFFIIKPFLLGLYKSISIIKKLTSLRAYPILSHTFETIPNQETLIHLSQLTTHSFAHGLCFDYF